jgi:hypothetical protein
VQKYGERKMLRFRMKILSKKNLMTKTSDIGSCLGLLAGKILIVGFVAVGAYGSTSVDRDIDSKAGVVLKEFAQRLRGESVKAKADLEREKEVTELLQQKLMRQEQEAKLLQEQLLAARSVPSAVAAEVSGDIQRQYDELQRQVDIYFHFEEIKKAVQEGGNLYMAMSFLNQSVGIDDTPNRSVFLRELREAIDRDRPKVEELTPQKLNFVGLAQEVAATQSTIQRIAEQILDDYSKGYQRSEISTPLSHFSKQIRLTYTEETRKTLSFQYAGTTTVLVKEEKKEQKRDINPEDLKQLRDKTTHLSDVIEQCSSLTEYRKNQYFRNSTESILAELKDGIYESVFKKQRTRQRKAGRTNQQNNEETFLEGSLANVISSFFSCLAQAPAYIQDQLEDGSVSATNSQSVRQIEEN